MKYNFKELLSPVDFELLSRDLLQRELSITLESFKEGKDGGVDFKFSTLTNTNIRMQMNYNFEWDIKKAKSNLLKHKISFETASSIFRDEKAISVSDEEHSTEEERWLTIGMDEVTRTLVVIHTFLTIDNNNCIIRIISARKATKKEANIYAEG